MSTEKRSCGPARHHRSRFSIFGICLLLTLQQAIPCTLWGVAGEHAAGQGTMVVKNRDWKPDHVQKTKVVKPRSGHRYFGLFAEGGEEPGLKGGTNIKGLTVLSASASSISTEARKSQPGKKGVLGELLTGYDSVDAVLARRDLFRHARAAFFLIADRNMIAVVEVGLDGKFAVRTETNGVAAHTNCYLDEELRGIHGASGVSSKTRLGRINTLLGETRSPMTVEHFKQMSADQHDGPDNSLWRTGKKARTLATWITEFPKQGPPVVHLKLANPGEPPVETMHVLDDKFWR